MTRKRALRFSILSDYLKAAQLLSDKNIFVFSGALVRLLVSRFSVGVGPRFYMLFEFSKVPLIQWHNYLLDEGLRPILRSVNNELIRGVVDNKVLFHEHCLRENIETAPILAKFQLDEKGEFYDYPTLYASLEKIKRCAISDEFFCKRVSGSWGDGSFKFKKHHSQWISGGDEVGDFRSLFLKRVVGVSNEWIIQPLISVHKNLTEITSSQGLSTVRAISVLDNGKVVLLAAMLRITVGNNVIDNFSSGQTGNLVASINLETGRLGHCKGSLSKEFPHVAIFDEHPDTGNPVAGFMIPHWESLKALVDRAHHSLSQFVTLAWDIAVTDEGPLIIEANPTYDVSGMQVAHEKGLKPMLFSYLGRLRPELVRNSIR